MPCSMLTDSRQAPISVPPEMLMIGTRSPPTSLNSHHHGSGFHGSPVDPMARSVDRSHPAAWWAPWGWRARIRVGDMPRTVMPSDSTNCQVRPGVG